MSLNASNCLTSHSFSESANDSDSYPYIGLNELAHMHYKMAVFYDDNGDSYEAETHYLMTIELNNDCDAMMSIGIHYEICVQDKEKAIEWFLYIIDLYDSKNAMYNLADLYESICDYNNALHYYVMVLDKGDLSIFDKIFSLCKKTKNIEEFNFCFYNFICYHDINNIDDFYYYMHGFNKYALLDFLERIIIDIGNYLHPIHKNCFENNLKIFKKDSCFNILENKIKLFTKLNHMSDCGICLEENVLHIDLKCGHCFCVDCYKKIEANPCPYCRL